MCENKPKELMTVTDSGGSITDLIHLAVDKLGGDGAESVVAAIEKLVELEDRVDRRRAEKEFYGALAEFQNECPPIKKTSTAKVVTKSGSNYSYNYAELDEIIRTVKPALFHRGFSFNWDSETVEHIIKCVIHLRHRNGHVVSSRFSIPVPASLGSMNDIQKNAAVLTYAKRQCLVEVLGLTTTENDTDAVSPSEPLTPDQLKTIEKAIKDSIPPSALPRFLKLLKIKEVKEIWQNDYEFALNKLAEAKKKHNEE